MASLKTQVFEARTSKTPPFTVEIEGYPAVLGETIPRRNAQNPDKLLTSPEEGINTILDIFTHSAKKYPDLRALGSRTLIKTHTEIKKVKKVLDGQLQEVDKEWTYKELSGYSYLTFKEYETLALQIGAGLRKLGLVSYDRVHLFASTSAHWLAMAHGAMSQSMAIVTAYDTLGEEGLRHSVVSTKARAIYLEPHLLHTFIKTLKAAKDIEFIILNTSNDSDIRAEDLEILKSSHDHIQVLKFGDLRRLGDFNPVPPTPPTPEDLCCIMYTSGSTGLPKGVPIKHKAVVAAVAGITTIVGPYLGPGDTLLTYLPLAHIFEFVFENACMYWGGTMGYGSPRTLSDTSVRNCQGDIREFKPSLLIGIPAVWETVKKGIIDNVSKGGWLVRTMFWGALYAKKFLLSNNLPGSSILDAVVFSKVREATGGRMRFCMNGAAPIAKDTQEFLSLAIAPLINGYGSTETTAQGALCDPLCWTSEACGDIPSGIEIKLVDFPEAGYYATNKPHPQGEIWIRGTPVFTGYYQNEAETKEAIAPGGWFMTGDIGEWHRDGQLKIIDRKKNLVKTLNGEYIALEKLESVYRSATIVANICIYASITETNPIAIIVPAEPALKKLATSLGVDGHGIGDLVHDERIQTAVLKDLQSVGRKAGLASMEIIVGTVLASEEWTAESGLITATNKLNRRGLVEKYRGEIEGGYKKARA